MDTKGGREPSSELIEPNESVGTQRTAEGAKSHEGLTSFTRLCPAECRHQRLLRHLPCRLSRHRRRLCYTPQSPGHPQQQWKTWWPGIGESCWESLPPTLCVDALGGHLARRWGALLRHLHLRLLRLGHQARLFVHLDPLLARNRRDQLANRFERQIVRRLEMNATLP